MPFLFFGNWKELGADSDCDVWGRIKKNQRGIEEQPNAAIKGGFGKRTIYLGIPDIRGILFFPPPPSGELNSDDNNSRGSVAPPNPTIVGISGFYCGAAHAPIKREFPP